MVQYWATSVFASRTMWWNAVHLLVAACALTDVTRVIPARYVPLQLALLAVVNLWLRTQTVRPVAFIAPGTTTPVDVARLWPSPPEAS